MWLPALSCRGEAPTTHVARMLSSSEAGTQHLQPACLLVYLKLLQQKHTISTARGDQVGSKINVPAERCVMQSRW
jgi:hypothetical protein